MPGFFDRMLARLGGTPCQPGRHKAWPGASRFTDYESPGAVSKRLEAFEKDTGTRNGSPPHHHHRITTATPHADRAERGRTHRPR